MSEKLTLPLHLRRVFTDVYDLQLAANFTGWHIWQQILESPHNLPQFSERLAALQRDCLSVSIEAKNISDDEFGSSTKTDIQNAIHRLSMLLDPAHFHKDIQNYRQLATSQDASLIGMLHFYYVTRGKFIELEEIEIQAVIGDIEALISQIESSELEQPVRQHLIATLKDLLFYLSHVVTFGFGVIRDTAGKLGGEAMFLSAQTASDSPVTDIVNGMANVTQRLLKMLIYTGAVHDGVVAIAPFVSAALKITQAH